MANNAQPAKTKANPRGGKIAPAIQALFINPSNSYVGVCNSAILDMKMIEI